MKTIRVDYEHNCETWWDAAREERQDNPTPECAGLIDVWGGDGVVMSDEDAAKFVAWAEKFDGWDEKPFIIESIKSLPSLEDQIIDTTEVRCFSRGEVEWMPLCDSPDSVIEAVVEEVAEAMFRYIRHEDVDGNTDDEGTVEVSGFTWEYQR